MIVAQKLPRALCLTISNANFVWIYQTSHYATKIKTAQVKLQKLDVLINRLKPIADKNKPIPYGCSNAISNQLAKEKPNYRQSLDLLQICRKICRNGNHQKATSSIHVQLKGNDKRELRQEHFILGMQLDQANGNIDGAEATLEEMQKTKIKIPPIAYQIMLQLYCRAGNIEKVNEWIDRISDAKFYLNDVSYNHLTQCYLKCGDIKLANHTMKIIKLNNFTINFHTLNEFVKYFARQGDIDEIIKIINFITDKRMSSRSNCVIDAIYELAINERQIDELLGYLDLDTEFIQWNSIRKTITKFVENGLISVVPKIVRKISTKLPMGVEFYVHELDRLDATPDQFDIAIEALAQTGIDIKITRTSRKTEKTRIKIDISLTDEKRFTECIRAKDIVEVESLIQKGTVSINRRKSVLLIGMYADVKNLDKSLDTLKKIRIYHKSFRLDYIDVTKLVKLMIEQNRNADEIVDFIKANRQDEVKHSVFVYEEAFRHLVASGNNTLLNQIYKSLIGNRHNDRIENPTEFLIMNHVKNGNFEQAVELYEKFLVDDNLAPFTSRIFIELIKEDKIDLLQRTYEALRKTRGQSLAQYRLAMAYIECGVVGKVKEATNIFDSGKINNLPEKLLNEIKVYERFNKIEDAKHLLKATTGNHCDRRHIYRSILEIYCKKNQVDEAIELWTEHLNDSAKPNQFFLQRLSTLLEKNNRINKNNNRVRKQDKT